MFWKVQGLKGQAYLAQGELTLQIKKMCPELEEHRSVTKVKPNLSVFTLAISLTYSLTYKTAFSTESRVAPKWERGGLRRT